MGTVKLEAFIRDEKGYKVRKENFVPGVIYGKGIDAVSVKFNKKDVERIIKSYGSRTNLTVVLNGKESFGFIRDTARDGLTEELIHMDIQVADEDAEITRNVPLVFKGTDKLVYNKLILQSNMDEVVVKGKAKLIPNAIEIDVSEANGGDTIMAADLDLPEGVICVNIDDNPIAVVIETKVEETEEESAEETESISQEAEE
ncbi:MAG: 50S ribosomal protein L25 [Clostridiales bacterium]|nr:50S ribosomal protein L25 [Clostridiales bacterium]